MQKKSSEYTGAKDRNGIKIYEGSTVQYLRSKYGVGPNRGTIGVVKWNDYLLRYDICWDGGGKMGELTVPNGKNMLVVEVTNAG